MFDMFMNGLILLAIAYWAYRAVGKKHPELQSVSLKSIFKIKKLPFVPRMFLFFLCWLAFMCVANEFLILLVKTDFFGMRP